MLFWCGCIVKWELGSHILGQLQLCSSLFKPLRLWCTIFDSTTRQLWETCGWSTNCDYEWWLYWWTAPQSISGLVLNFPAGSGCEPTAVHVQDEAKKGGRFHWVVVQLAVDSPNGNKYRLVVWNITLTFHPQRRSATSRYPFGDSKFARMFYSNGFEPSKRWVDPGMSYIPIIAVLGLGIDAWKHWLCIDMGYLLELFTAGKMAAMLHVYQPSCLCVSILGTL